MSSLLDITPNFSIESLFLNNFNCHAFIKNHKGEYLYANDVLAHATGFAKGEDLVGITDFDYPFLSAKEAFNLRKNDEEIILKGNTKSLIEHVTFFDRKKVILISHKAPLLSNNSNKILGVIGMSFILNHNGEFSNTWSNNKIQKTRCAFSQEKILFTKREKECIYYIKQGRTAKEIAIFLNISIRTVETYIDNIKAKFNCNTKSQLLDKLTIYGFA